MNARVGCVTVGVNAENKLLSLPVIVSHLQLLEAVHQLLHQGVVFAHPPEPLHDAVGGRQHAWHNGYRYS